MNLEDIYNICKNEKYDLPLVTQEKIKNNNQKIFFYCKLHNNKYLQSIKSHLLGHTGCKICRYDKVRKKLIYSWDDIINICNNKKIDLPINKEEYETSKSVMTFYCHKHNCYYKHSLVSHLKNRTGCNQCRIDKQRKKRQKSIDEIISFGKENDLDLPIRNQKYINNKTKLIWHCKKHHINYEQTFDKHKLGQLGCKQCYEDTTFKNIKKLKKICIKQNFDLPKQIIGKIDNHDYAIFICKIHGKYKQRIDAHLAGQGCMECSGKRKKTNEEYYDECKEKGLDLPIEYYQGINISIKYQCNKGHIYKQNPHNHLKGTGCPICKGSHGEKFIRNYLDKNNIKYIFQKKFNDLKDKNFLSYDFYLPNKNILIEYQGIQHYENIDYFGGKERFYKQQYHDYLKADYANKHNYKLIEISYIYRTQEQVNNFLDKSI